MKRRFKQLVGDTEPEDCQKQRFHISRSFSSDTCQGNTQNSKCKAETTWKARKKRKRGVISDWTKSVDQSSNQKLLPFFSFLRFLSGLTSTFTILTIPLTSVRRRAWGNMKPMLLKKKFVFYKIQQVETRVKITVF